MPPFSPLRLALLVALTMVAFAANSLLNRLALLDGATGPLAFAALRLCAGAVVLSLAVALRGGGRLALRRPGSAQKAAALALYMLGFSLAYRGLDAGLGALILFGGVQLTMFAGAWALGEGIGRQRLIGAGVALAGLVWLLWPAGPVSVPLEAGALMLAAALGWGIYSLLGRGARDPLADTASAFRLATLPVALMALSLWDGISPQGAALAVLSGAVTSGLGYALWYALLPRLQATVAAVAQLTVPPIAILGGALWLGELPGWAGLGAMALVLGGVLIAIWPRAS